MPLRSALSNPSSTSGVLRWAITGVAVFVFFFSLLFPAERVHLPLFRRDRGHFRRRRGAVIVGGLYWKRGTTAGGLVEHR